MAVIFIYSEFLNINYNYSSITVSSTISAPVIKLFARIIPIYSHVSTLATARIILYFIYYTAIII